MTKEHSLIGAACCFTAGVILSHQSLWSDQWGVSLALNRLLDLSVVLLAGVWLGTVWQKQLDTALPATMTQLSQQVLGIGQQVAVHSENFSKIQGVLNEQGKAISQLMPNQKQAVAQPAVPIAQLSPVPSGR